jgi:prophage tail gpP-like protein
VTDVRLRVNGKEYGGWKSARVTRSIESVCGSFSLSLSANPGWPIREDDECVVMLDEEVIITGYVDVPEASFSESEHSVSVSGRDRTGDIVDSSAVLKTWEFYNTPVLVLAQRLCQPFGIPVTLAFGLELPPPPARLSVDPGDSVYDVIERACRTAALLPVADGRGGLRLMRPGTDRTHTALVEGENLKAGSVTRDATGRFRTYTVRGQHSGGDSLSGASAATVQATAEDPNVGRAARVLLVRPEGNMTAALAKTRAAWEASVRAARSLSVSVTVQGWTQGNGALWPVNALVPVRSPKLDIDGEMLITEATYNLDDSTGTTTTLQLRVPEAFEPEPVVPKRAKKNTGVSL